MLDAPEEWIHQQDLDWLRYFEGGFRITHFELTEDSRHTYRDDGVFKEGFLGSIDRLEENQNYFPSPYARLRLHEFFFAELGWERFGATTRTYWDNHSDGDIKAKGPSFQLLAFMPTSMNSTPYLGMGFALLNASFSNDGVWHYGFNSANDHLYDDWVEAGRDPWVNGGYRRNIEVDNTTAFLLSLGCSSELREHLHADLLVRKMWANLNAKYYLSWYGTDRRDDRGSYDFPLDSLSIQLGIRYTF
jgi:hypothetical protein